MYGRAQAEQRRDAAAQHADAELMRVAGSAPRHEARTVSTESRCCSCSVSVLRVCHTCLWAVLLFVCRGPPSTWGAAQAVMRGRPPRGQTTRTARARARRRGGVLDARGYQKWRSQHRLRRNIYPGKRNHQTSEWTGPRVTVFWGPTGPPPGGAQAWHRSLAECLRTHRQSARSSHTRSGCAPPQAAAASPPVRPGQERGSRRRCGQTLGPVSRRRAGQ